MSPYVAEFIGTAVLLCFGNSVNAATTLKYSYANGAGWIVTTIGWGLAVTFGVYAASAVSGAHINPAVTVSLAISGDFEWVQVPGYIIAQVLGGIVGASLAWLQYLPHWGKTEDQSAKLGVFCTAGAIDQKSANLVSEMLGTMILMFGLLMIGANQFAEGLNPLVVGGLIVLIGMAQGGSTGYAINPARDFGPRLAHFLLPIKGKGSSKWDYSWVPIVGPIVGGGAGVAIYGLAFNSTTSALGWACIIITAIAIFYAIIEEGKKK
ncbi:MIP/aquaporin family protein [Roseivirga pacifica]|uniref:MIP/aquaporin family protein n=1 Tax=Roseivirga pacifica TaxID=1267423 RepID=UPI00227AFE28|nr:MIP/aquaporin family protein [Roseivirga pacifica]